MHAIASKATNHLRAIIFTRKLGTMAAPIRPRRFAPLNPEKKKDGDVRPVLKGIVFDVDGTLCLPQNYMFGEMRHVCAPSELPPALTKVTGRPLASTKARISWIIYTPYQMPNRKKPKRRFAILSAQP